MDEGRYGLVRRQEDRHRKFVCVINDILKTKTEVYESWLSREKYETSFRYVKNAMTVRRNLVRKKVLQKCLEMRRRGMDGVQSQYGVYNGAPLYSMSRDVETYIAARHPKVRRLRKVQRLLHDSIENGAILDSDTMTRKVEEFFRKRMEDMDKNQDQKRNKRDIISDTVSNSSYTRSESPTSVKTKRDRGTRKKQKPLMVSTTEAVNKECHESAKPSLSGEKTASFVLKRTPTLILPPIMASKPLVQQ